jgi:hypothetical protein
VDPRQSYQMDGHLQDYVPFSCTQTKFSLFDTLEVSKCDSAPVFIGWCVIKITKRTKNNRNIHTVTQVIDDVFSHHLGFSIRAVSLQPSSLRNGNDWGCTIYRC